MFPLFSLSLSNAPSSLILYRQLLRELGFIDWIFNNMNFAHSFFLVDEYAFVAVSVVGDPHAPPLFAAPVLKFEADGRLGTVEAVLQGKDSGVSERPRLWVVPTEAVHTLLSFALFLA